jgi:hypothetical protein
MNITFDIGILKTSGEHYRKGNENIVLPES